MKRAVERHIMYIPRWKIAEWIASAEGKAALQEASEKAERDCTSYREAARVDPETLNQPMTI